MIYLELFWSFAQIGLLSIGGGYAAMPLIQQQAVELHHWLTMEQFADMLSISEMTPGPIAINSATFVGTQVAGLPGAIVATIGCVMPSFLIVLVLAWIYYKFRRLKMVQGVLGGIRPAVIAMIASAGLSLMFMSFFGKQSLSEVNVEHISWVAVIIFGIALFMLRKWRINPLYIMAGAGAAGVIVYAVLPQALT